MQTVSVVLDELASPPAWKVHVGGLEMRFYTADDAQNYASTLQERLDAPHDLPAEHMFEGEPAR